MGLTRALAGLAAGAPVLVFPVVGEGSRARVGRMRLDDSIEVVDSPRAATVLLVAGRLPRGLWEPAVAVHDQLAPPRATLRWGTDGDPFPDAVEVSVSDDPGPALRRLAREAVQRAGGEPAMHPDVDPNPWRGVGPFGQGGSGMTGGTPYGRPMTDRAPDRDGLQLDQLPVRVGPFFPAFPPGLALDVKLQGDVVQEATVVANPFTASPGDPASDLFEHALGAPVPIGELELARARHHIVWLADALGVAGLAALGRRARLLADHLTPASGPALRRLRRLVGASQVLRWSLPDGGDPGGDLGPLSRAAGRTDDARQHDPAYRALGFEPVVQHGGGLAGRWRQRLDEAAQSLLMAAQAGATSSTVTGEVESPRGRLSSTEPSPSARLLDLVPGLVAGLEWGDAVATVVSLDVDLEEAARHPAPHAVARHGDRRQG